MLYVLKYCSFLPSSVTFKQGVLVERNGSFFLTPLFRPHFRQIIATFIKFLVRKKLGLLNYRWEESTQGPPRKYYMITPLGREQLEGLDAAWIELAEGIETIRETNRRTK